MLKFDDLDLVQDSASQYGDGVADRLALLHRYRKEATFKGGKRKDTVMLGSRVWAPSSLDDLREKAKQKNALLKRSFRLFFEFALKDVRARKKKKKGTLRSPTIIALRCFSELMRSAAR